MKKQRLDERGKGKEAGKDGKTDSFYTDVRIGRSGARDPELGRGSPADVGGAGQPECLNAYMPQVSIYTSTARRVMDVYTTSRPP